MRLQAPKLPPTSTSTSTRALSTRPLLPPHSTLATFLSYASSTSLSRTSTVYIGTYYEYTCQHALSRLGLTLARTGGQHDKGIDLLGTWALPGARAARVLVQCKAVKARVGPAVVRELEGAVNGVPVYGASKGEGEAGPGVIALLCAPVPATKGVRDALGRSGAPMGYVMIGRGEDAGADAGRITQVLWNRAAGERGGLAGLSVGVRYLDEEVERQQGDEEEEEEKEKKALRSEVVLQDGEGGLWDWPVGGGTA